MTARTLQKELARGRDLGESSMDTTNRETSNGIVRLDAFILIAVMILVSFVFSGAAIA
jgi:hypothetical protein